MKKFKIIILTIITTTLLSCGANPTKLMSKVMDKVYIGMPISEFKEKIEKEQLVEMNSKVTIYKIAIKTYNDIPTIGWRSDHRFFYFLDGKLNKVDKGERMVDYRIKVD